MSTYYEINNCDGTINTNTKILIEFYNKLLQPDLPIINYNLFNSDIGGFFDDLVLFGRNEIILNNKVFNTRSTFNIATNKWITYKDQYIKRYNCDKIKRRF